MRLVAVLMSAALAWTLPRPARTAVSEAPRIDLEKLETRGDEATAPAPGGGRARLTLDPKLQRAAYRLLARARPIEGAVVVLDVRRGRILVAAEYRREASRGQHLVTRATEPAASVFKIVTTTALLRKYLSPQKMVCFYGGMHRIEPEHLRPARGPDARCSPFRNALGYSRNAVFAQLAHRTLDRDSLVDAAETLGFNGHVPSDLEAKVGTLDVAEEPLEFARTAAGFRGSTLSPLGAAHLANVIALRGRASLLRIVESSDGFEAPTKRKDLGRVLNGSIAVELRRMMEITVHAGTSLDAFTNRVGMSYLGSVRVAGKTGTLRGAPDAPMTTWFTGFAPSRKPEIVVTAMLNNGRIWRQKANEVARDMLRVYFAEKGTRGVTDPFVDP